MMILPFQTQRIQAQMQELTLRQAIDLCQIPDHLNELGTSRALEAIISETSLPLAQWTAQERIGALCHYITAQEQGDWAVAENGMLSDYLLEQDYPTVSYQFDDLEIVPLTAPYAEAVERAVNGMSGDLKGGSWLIGAMAATIRGQGDTWDGTADEFVQENITRLLELPESEFNHLLQHFQMAQKHLAHGFELVFSADGIAVLPQKGGAGLPPARFPFVALIGETTLALWRAFDPIGADDFHAR